MIDMTHIYYKSNLQSINDIDIQAISKMGVHYEVGNVTVWDSDPKSHAPVIVMLHPNSCSRMFFVKQMEDKRLTDHFRLIAMDLPGHGDSRPANDPASTYTFPGYGKEVAGTLEKLAIQDCFFLGWSLGGHAALEAMHLIKNVRGIILTGTPPMEVSPEGFGRVFKEVPQEVLDLMKKPNFTEADAVNFISGVGTEKWMFKYGRKCDGRARENLMNWVSRCTGGDQRKLVAETNVPLAFISGEHDPASPREYLESLQIGNLWGIHYIPDCAHNVVYAKSEDYNAKVLEFLKDH